MAAIGRAVLERHMSRFRTIDRAAPRYWGSHAWGWGTDPGKTKDAQSLSVRTDRAPFAADYTRRGTLLRELWIGC